MSSLTCKLLAKGGDHAWELPKEEQHCLPFCVVEDTKRSLISQQNSVFRRDIDALSLDMPIYTQTGRYGGGIYVTENFQLDRKYFTKTELALLEKIIACAKRDTPYLLTHEEIRVLQRILTNYTNPQIPPKNINKQEKTATWKLAYFFDSNKKAPRSIGCLDEILKSPSCACFLKHINLGMGKAKRFFAKDVTNRADGLEFSDIV